MAFSQASASISYDSRADPLQSQIKQQMERAQNQSVVELFVGGGGSGEEPQAEPITESQRQSYIDARDDTDLTKLREQLQQYFECYPDGEEMCDVVGPIGKSEAFIVLEYWGTGLEDNFRVSEYLPISEARQLIEDEVETETETSTTTTTSSTTTDGGSDGSGMLQLPETPDPEPDKLVCNKDTHYKVKDTSGEYCKERTVKLDDDDDNKAIAEAEEEEQDEEEPEEPEPEEESEPEPEPEEDSAEEESE